MAFEKILTELLTEHAMTKMELSKNANIPYTTICGWFSGRLPDYNAINKLAQFFNVTADYLLGRESEYGEPATESATQPRDELLLLQTYRQMSEGKKRALFQMLDLDIEAISRKKSVVSTQCHYAFCYIKKARYAYRRPTDQKVGSSSLFGCTT